MTKHYFVAIAPNTRNVITRTDKCLVCGDDTYWSDDPDPVCKTCASDPENIAHKLDDARAEVRELRAALEQARALLAELAACGYECQAGALENNTAYRELAALLAPAGGAE